MLVHPTLRQPSLNLSMAAWRVLKSFFVDGLTESDTFFIYSILYDICKSLTHSHLYVYVPYWHLYEKVAKQVTTAQDRVLNIRKCEFIRHFYGDLGTISKSVCGEKKLNIFDHKLGYLLLSFWWPKLVVYARTWSFLCFSHCHNLKNIKVATYRKFQRVLGLQKQWWWLLGWWMFF